MPRSNLPYDPPLTHVFTSFCNSIIESMQLRASVIAARVISLDPAGHERTRVTTTAGVFVARQLIWAGSTRTPTVPAPIVELLAASPKIAHGSDVDLPNIGPLDGHHVIVVGGGLTAGHLAVGARARGADVTLVTRRPIVERDFDVEPGWLGPRHLDGYSQLRSPTRRFEVAQTARGGGTMPSWMHRRLELEGSDGSITNVVGEIESIAECGAGLDIRAGGQRINAGHCWLATGTRPDIRADIALGHLVDEHVRHTHERRVGLEPPQQDPGRAEQQPRRAARARLAAHRVADRVAHPLAALRRVVAAPAVAVGAASVR